MIPISPLDKHSKPQSDPAGNDTRAGESKPDSHDTPSIRCKFHFGPVNEDEGAEHDAEEDELPGKGANTPSSCGAKGTVNGDNMAQLVTEV